MSVAVGAANAMQTQATSFRAPKKPAPLAELHQEAAFVGRLLEDQPSAWREFNAIYAAPLHRAIGRILSPNIRRLCSGHRRVTFAHLRQGPCVVMFGHPRHHLVTDCDVCDQKWRV